MPKDRELSSKEGMTIYRAIKEFRDTPHPNITNHEQFAAALLETMGYYRIVGAVQLIVRDKEVSE